MKEIRKVMGGLGNLMFKQAYIIAQFLEGKIPDTYIQSSRFFEKSADTIKPMFSEGIVPNDYVAIHIRRGDYLYGRGPEFHVNLWETDYYKKATTFFPDGTKYMVFCRDNQGWEQDKADRQWCRDKLVPLIGENFELPPKENTETEDFNLMAGCKSVIMANSSFSWWAAYLGIHEKVICPEKWFVDGYQRTELRPEWIII